MTQVTQANSRSLPTTSATGKSVSVAGRYRKAPLKAFLPLLLLIFVAYGSPALSLGGDLLCRMSEKGPAQSLYLYNFALTLNGKNIGALLGRAEAYKRLGQLDTALKDVEKALTIAKSAPALALKGEILNREQQSPLIWQEPVQEAAQTKEGKALALTYQKRAYQAVYGEAQPAEIIRLSSLALLLDKNLPRAFAYRANAYNQLGDYHRALVDCRQGMRCPLTKSDRALLYTQKAQALYGQGKLDDTIYSAMQALRLRPTEDNYTDAVAYLMENGDYDQALSLTSKWRQDYKVSPEMKMLRKRLFQLKGLPHLAKEIKDIPWEQDIIADYYYQRALTFYKAKNYKNALKAANNAVSFYEKDEQAKAIAMCSEANLQ